MTRATALGLFCAALTAGCGAAVTVRIDTPVDGAAVGGTLQVKVLLTGEPSKVELVAGDVAVASADVAAGKAEVLLSWDTAPAAEGEVTLKARALDGGEKIESAPIKVVVDHTAPVVKIGTKRLSVLKGSATLSVSIEEAHPRQAALYEGEEYLADVDGTSVVWDTTQVADGLHRVQLVVTDAAGNQTVGEEVPFVVLNTVTESAITYDPAARLTVPENWQSVEIDVRGMAKNTGNVKRILSWMTWDKSAAMNLEYSIGLGLCPHRGTKFVGAESTQGEIILDLPRSELPSEAVEKLRALTTSLPQDVYPVNNDPLTFGTFFGHIAIMDAADHVGDTVPIEIHIVLFQ